MKHLERILSLLILVSAGLFFANCGGDDPEGISEEETQLNKFKATWTLSSANDGQDRTTEYPGMTATFSGTFVAGGTYTYTSAATDWPSLSPWKKDGSWKFKGDAIGNTIVRLDDAQEMKYTFSNSDKTLTIEFTYGGAGFNNGRVSSVEGDWTFVFTRP
jgi:hypothetical protein